jgi:rsbT co-antagonist protein RsbR
MNSVSVVANYIIENAKSIATEVVEYNIAKLDFELPEVIKDNLITFQTEFIKFLGEVVTYEDDRQVAPAFIDWYKPYEQQVEPSPIAKVSSIVAPYAEVRLLFNNRLTSISKDHHLSIEDAAMIQNRLNYMLDIGLTRSIIGYEEHTEKESKKRRAELMELSSPIVPFKDGIAVLPLIGSVDYQRAEHLISTTIPRVSELKVTCLIIDFSGIVSIDTEVANHIFNVYSVLRLLGINVIFTGIRPDLASKAVNTGINFSLIKTYSNVQKALESMGT